MLFSLLPLFFNFLCADIGDEQTLMSLESQKNQPNWKTLPPENPASPKIIRKPTVRGNLPPYLVRTKTSTSSESEPIHYPKLHAFNKSQMNVGDILDCLIEQDIKAYVGSVSPIRAEVISGEHKGKVFVGNATMDPQTRSVVVEFNSVRNPDTKVNHTLKATIHSTSGEVGLEGTFHSRYWQFFFATMLSRAAQGYSQATVERERNFFGDFQTVPNPENAGKVGLVEGASATTEMIAERAQSAPEYITKEGPISAKIFIVETPKLTN